MLRLWPETRHVKNSHVCSCKLLFTAPCPPKSPGKQSDISALINGNPSPVTPEHNIQLKPWTERLCITWQSHQLHAESPGYKHPNPSLDPTVHLITCKRQDLLASLPYAKSYSMSKPWDFSVYLSTEVQSLPASIAQHIASHDASYSLVLGSRTKLPLFRRKPRGEILPISALPLLGF